MVDSEGCERNPFAEDVFRRMAAYLLMLSKIGIIICPYRFGPLRHVLIISIVLHKNSHGQMSSN